MLSSGLSGPGRPRNRPRPARISVITLIALVYRNSTAERWAIRRAGAPRSTISHAPTARLPDASQRYRRAEGLLAERHPGPDPQRRPLEHLEERHHVAGARKNLEQDRDDDPLRLHVRDRGRHALEPRDCQQQPNNQRARQDQRDEPVAQAAPRLGSVYLFELEARRCSRFRHHACPPLIGHAVHRPHTSYSDANK